jgi:error-prone DNA polymerase
MGFWSPHTLVQDARRHGVVVRTPDLNASLAKATLEPSVGSPHTSNVDFCGDRKGEVQPAVRLGIGSVRGIGEDLAKEIEAGRPYSSPEDLVRRVPALNLAQLEAMATAGVFGECFGLERREALWAVGAVAQSRPNRLAGAVTGATAPCLPGMSSVEEAVADLWSTGVSPDGHPTRFLRDHLDELGVVTSAGLWDVPPGSRVTVAGVVTHRQRPMTAQGTTFLNLEDETGLINVVVSKGCWARFRRVAREAPAMTVRGRLERAEGVINLVAEHLTPLELPGSSIHASRDFR